MMESLWLTLRAELRRRWRPMLGLSVLLGVIGGVVLTAAAGAERTDTAYPRLLQWARAAQVQLIPNSDTVPIRYFAALGRLPQVAAMSTMGLYQATLPGRGSQLTPVETMSSPDGAFGISADRVKVVAGHRFDPRAAGQAMVDQKLADLEHLRPGGQLHLLLIPSNPKTGTPQPRLAFQLTFRVSAVVTFDSQIVPQTGATGEPTALLSPPFTATATAAHTSYGTAAGIRLRPGASMAAFLSAATALARQYPATGRKVDVISLSSQTAATERALHPQAVAPPPLAVIVQLLGRQLTLESAEFPVLRALGMTRGRLAVLALARTAVVTAASGLVAVAIALAASPLTPIGAARVAEPAPGVQVNLPILAAGFAVFALVPLVLLIRAAWAAAARAQGPLGVAGPWRPARVSRLGALAGRAGPVTGGIGVRMAFEPGHGRTAVPVRSALIGTTVAIASVLAAVVFGTSLIGLVATPHRYGQNWAQMLDLGFGGVTRQLAAELLARDPPVSESAVGNYGQLTVRATRTIVPAVGIGPAPGPGFLTLLAGRAPAAPGEIALGAQTMRAVHARLGQTVPVTVSQVAYPPSYGRISRMMRIVGEAVFPAFSRGSFTPTDLGTGAVVPAAVLSEPSPSTGCTGRVTCYNFFLLRYPAGSAPPGRSAGVLPTLTRKGSPAGSCLATTAQRPSDIRDYGGVRDTPLLLGIVLALLAVATMTHVLLTSGRRRRRDLAMLKALGLVRRQVLGVVEWQAVTLAATALLFGIPLGLLAGRWAWVLFADAAGVSPAASVPVPLVLATIPVTLALAALIASGPGWTAARIRPAVALRAE